MYAFEFGDLRLIIQGETLIKGDRFAATFYRPPDQLSPDFSEIIFTGQIYSLNGLKALQPLQANNMYELFQTDRGLFLAFHWVRLRFAYGFFLEELSSQVGVTVYFDPSLVNELPLTLGRFLSTVGLHSILLRHKAPILHASYINYNDHALVFTAPSGVGKSTQAGLWAQYADTEIINGDRALLRRRGSTWHAFGYPCCGSSNICLDRTLPLSAIVILSQGSENRIEQLSISEKTRALFSGIEHYLWDETETELAFTLAQSLAQETEIVRLVCRPDKGAVDILRKYLDDRRNFLDY